MPCRGTKAVVWVRVGPAALLVLVLGRVDLAEDGLDAALNPRTRR